MHHCRLIVLVTVGLFLTFASGAEAQQRRGRPGVPDGVKALRNLPYVEDGHERQKLDLFLPENADGPLPVVVWIHGGAWRGGSKEGNRALYLSARGYAVAGINYRLSQHAKFPAQIHDCKAAIRWLRGNAKNHNLDPDRIGVWGASAGGHLVALLGTSGDVKELEGDGGNSEQSSRVQAVCDWFGPSDFQKFVLNRPNDNNPVHQLLGGPPSDNPELAKLASPVAFATKDDPPFLIMHGDQDRTVPMRQSRLLHDALKEAGVDVTVKVLEGSGHGGGEFNSEESRELIAEFFDRHLKSKGESREE